MDHQRGAVDRIAGGEDLRVARLVMIHHHVAPRIELQCRILHEALMDDVHKSRRQDHEIHFEKEIRAWNLLDLPVVVLPDPFGLAAVQSVGVDSRAAQKFFGRYGPASLAAFLMRGRCSHHSGPHRPGRIGRTRLGRFG